jgi:acyl carrier protein
MSQAAEESPKSWTRDEVEKTLKEILIDALGVDKSRIVPGASLVHDLGAESIDFLDIGFRVQQTFGVELPNRAIQDKALSWRNMGEFTRILQERYGIRITSDEMRQLHTMGIPEVLQRLAQKQDVTVRNGEAEKVASELADRLAREVESIGFKASLIDREGISKLLLQSLSSPKIIEGMLRLFTVDSLVDFITARLDDKAQSRK